MRKTVVSQPARLADEFPWIDLERTAQVHVTSEHSDHPVESALAQIGGFGWRANEPGEQMIRILFDQPRDIHHIRLSFNETELERTQEFVLRWSTGQGQPMCEVVRQQWNFSPKGSTSETVDYNVQLVDVLILELTIRPDISGRDRVATLTELRLL
jgi:uncharacterized protein (DUF2249 family)